MTTVILQCSALALSESTPHSHLHPHPCGYNIFSRKAWHQNTIIVLWGGGSQTAEISFVVVVIVSPVVLQILLIRKLFIYQQVRFRNQDFYSVSLNIKVILLNTEITYTYIILCVCVSVCLSGLTVYILVRRTVCRSQFFHYRFQRISSGLSDRSFVPQTIALAIKSCFFFQQIFLVTQCVEARGQHLVYSSH